MNMSTRPLSRIDALLLPSKEIYMTLQWLDEQGEREDFLLDPNTAREREKVIRRRQVVRGSIVRSDASSHCSCSLDYCPCL